MAAQMEAYNMLKKCVAKAFEKRKTISGSHYFTEAKGESTHDDGIDHD